MKQSSIVAVLSVALVLPAISIMSAQANNEDHGREPRILADLAAEIQDMDKGREPKETELMAEIESQVLKEEMAEVMEEIKNDMAMIQEDWKADSVIKCSSRDPLAKFNRNTLPPLLVQDVRDFLQSSFSEFLRRRGFRGDINCGGGLRISQIMELANSIVRPLQIFPVTNKHSYAYLPEKQFSGCSKANAYFFESSIYGPARNEHTNRLNKPDSEMYLLDYCPDVRQYWSGWTPCYHCQKSLLDWKKKYFSNPNHHVVIHLGKEYDWSPNKSTKKDCSALMVARGFEFKPWNWSTFKSQINFISPRAGFCPGLIDLIERCEEFQIAMRNMQNYINEVNHIAENTDERKLERDC